MNYYKKGEEKFGPFSSRVYAFGVSRSLKPLYGFIVGDVKKIKPKSILDVGAGPGDLIVMIKKEVKNAEVYCVDPSESMQKIAVKKFDRNKIEGIKYKLGSSGYIPFKNRFDLIVTSISFHHWKEKEKSIRYLLGRLNKDGKLVVYEFCYDKLNNLQKKFIGKHSLSIEEAKKYEFKGYDKNIKIYNRIIRLTFSKK
jgi:ubiquinone/menaquinone biosynthesis C-methylase UbiE